MAGKRVREQWEKYGRRGRQVEAFIGLMDSMSHDQWVVVGETRENRDFHEYDEALKECDKVSISATVEKALSSWVIVTVLSMTRRLLIGILVGVSVMRSRLLRLLWVLLIGYQRGLLRFSSVRL